MIEILGKKLKCTWLLVENKPVAYSLHYTKEKAWERAEKINRFHGLRAEIIEDEELDKELEAKIKRYLEGKRIKIDISLFNYKEVYKELLKLKKGETMTYSELATKTGLRIHEVIQALAHNPALILIPCHRIIRKDGKLSGYTPLGKEFKKLLLEKERLTRKFY